MKSENKKQKKSYVGEGVALGLSFGTIAGLLFLNGNIGLGAGLGLCIGLILSAIVDERAARQDKDNAPANAQDQQGNKT